MAKVAIQGGVKNYLPSREVTVPVEAKSSKNHVKAHLAYITDKEQKLLLEKNLHGSLKGKPNRGPGGLPSLQGDFGPGGKGSYSEAGTGRGVGNSKDKDISAFDFNNKTQTYELSKKNKNKGAVKDFLQGKLGYQAGKKPSFWDSSNAYGLKTRNQIYNSKRNLANIERFQKTRMNKIQYALKNMKDFPGFIDDDMSWQDAFDYAPSFQDPNLALAGGKRGLTQKTINDILSGKRSNIDFASPSGLPSAIGFATDQLGKIMGGPITRERLQELKSEYDTLGSLNPAEQTTFGLMEKYEPNRYKQQFGPPEPGNGDGPRPYLPINYNTGAAEGPDYDGTNQFTYDDNAFGPGGDARDVTRASYIFNKGGRAGKAEGGIMELRARRAFGGIMDRVTGRKAYGLGSIFKSVGKAVSGVAKAAGKVLKSDLGKAALLAAGAYYAPAMFGGTTGFGAGSTYGNFARGLMSPNLIGPMTKAGSLGRTIGNFAINNKALTAGILGIGGAALMGPAKVDQMPGDGNRGGSLKNSQGGEGQQAIRDEIYEAYESGDQDRIMQLQKFYGYKLPPLNAVQDLTLPSSLPFPNYAEGGRIGFNTGSIVPPVEMPDPMERMLKNMTPEEKAKFKMMLKINAARMPEYKPDPNAIPPVEMPTYPRTNRAEGGLLDMGGMEKDYRAEGGFVPIGEYEKKDDVPARLSVNEFVFTADAVRGAGQGDIDKGAEIMENMMENLENGGTVSEESQGNNGAQQMFETSQRLGEVV